MDIYQWMVYNRINPLLQKDHVLIHKWMEWASRFFQTHILHRSELSNQSMKAG